ncbi:MAG: hypothetical protein ABL886_01700, partial [Rhodoglobus sp.]
LTAFPVEAGLPPRIVVHDEVSSLLSFDERWRQVARFRDSDASPKEEFVPHAAGDSGLGGASYVDLVVCRDKDANTAWTSASDATLEERVFYCQNWRADVSAIVSASGGILEGAKYSAYGMPFGMPGGDADGDGDCDTADAVQVQAWITGAVYNVKGDLDLDGDVDSSDKSTVQSIPYVGAIGGQKVLSAIVGNVRAWAGGDASTRALLSVTFRNRLLSTALGRWVSRDPLTYVDGPGMYSMASTSPIVNRDPYGLSESGGMCADEMRCRRLAGSTPPGDPIGIVVRGTLGAMPGWLCRMACVAAGAACALLCAPAIPATPWCLAGCAVATQACTEGCN